VHVDFWKGHSYVAEDRQQSSLDGFWKTLTAEQISGIEAVAMDMWDPYIASVREHVSEPDGKIVFDKFHVAQHLGDAVDQVRRKENQTLKAGGSTDWRGHATTGCGIPPRWSRKSVRNSPN
jgi:transposase